VTFDTHIDLGNVLTLVGMVITLYTFHVANVKRIHGLEFKVGLMWKHFAHKFELEEDIDKLDGD